MNTEKKLLVLQQIYDIYASYTDTLDLSCRKRCCRCCTRNVTLTTLEAVAILDRLDPRQRNRLLVQIQNQASLPKFQPLVTTNEMAERCARGEDLPAEMCDPDWGPCPLLQDRSCPLYPLRPFACRCLISTHDCEITGHADIDEFSLTVNSAFLQVIEHLDSGGCTGNLSDVILLLSKAENMSAYRQGWLDCTTRRLIPNRSLKVLMIPPQHRAQAAPLLRQLQRIDLS